MRLDINLATQPYEDARQFWMRWGTAVGVLGLLTLVLLTLDVTGWLNASRDRAAMKQARELIAKRDQVRSNAERILNLPQNRKTRDQSQFLNQLIERKAFSWTRVLESLEQVMPRRVHLVSITPTLDEDNQLALRMVVAGDSRDRAIELAQRMEESRSFAQTSIVRVAHTESQTGDTEQVELAAIYIPATVQDEGAPPGSASTKTAPPTTVPAVKKKSTAPRSKH